MNVVFFQKDEYLCFQPLERDGQIFFFKSETLSLSANKIPFKSFTVNICEQLKMGLGMQQQRQLYLGWGTGESK